MNFRGQKSRDLDRLVFFKKIYILFNALILLVLAVSCFSHSGNSKNTLFWDVLRIGYAKTGYFLDLTIFGRK